MDVSKKNRAPRCRVSSALVGSFRLDGAPSAQEHPARVEMGPTRGSQGPPSTQNRPLRVSVAIRSQSRASACTASGRLSRSYCFNRRLQVSMMAGGVARVFLWKTSAITIASASRR